ncbi:MAG: triose-phosphate isomerase [Alphaproteobacteria bacterium]|nr:triose-phosphate isomerase [Alphaproteobacteria bacterium]
MRRPLIAGNWKMNCLKADGIALAAGIAEKYAAATAPKCDVLVCPPAIWILPVVDAVKGRIAVGAEDAHAAESGAHTGDISVPMIKDAGASYIIVGHSERRTDHHETNADVKAKAEAVIGHGLTAVICIGETEAERDAGKTIDVCRAQIQGSVPDKATAENVVIAYEPVWAIGTGRTPTTQDVADVHKAIRTEIANKLGKEVADKMRILYGGSVKPSNAKELMALEDVDGALVGGASLKVADFWAIIETCL